MTKEVLSDTIKTTQPMKTSSKTLKPKQATDRDQPEASRRGIATTFWIQSEDLDRLKQFANEHQLSASNVINRALRRFLAEGNPFIRQ
jgi:hypothetical protein